MLVARLSEALDTLPLPVRTGILNKFAAGVNIMKITATPACGVSVAAFLPTLAQDAQGVAAQDFGDTFVAKAALHR